MTEGQQQGQTSSTPQQQTSGQQQTSSQQQVSRQICQPQTSSNVAPQQQQMASVAATSQQQVSQQPQQVAPTQQQQPTPIQPQQAQVIQPQQPTPIQPQQHQNMQQQQTMQQQQQLQQNAQPIQTQAIQQMPQLQQIAPQQTQHVLPNLQAHNMTSVPLSMAMATNPMTGNMTAGNLRPQLGQLPQVQVIHQAMHSPTFMPQFTYNQQQQLMLQNMQAAMQANMVNMNPQQINMTNMVAMQQNRSNTNMFTPVPAAGTQQTPSTPTTPNMMTISSSPSSQTVSSSPASAGTNSTKAGTVNTNKQQTVAQPGQQAIQQQQPQQQLHTLGQVQQAQATAMIGGKPIILGQAAGGIIQGQIGMISAGQLQTTQAYATGQTFGQIQSKQGQAIGMANNSGQGQIQLNSSQGALRFSQPGMMASNAGNAQILSSQPVFTNQMIQAMASQLQFPQQPIMLTQGQTPSLSTGQKLYINPVQTQNLMTGVQPASINNTFKSPAQQNVQQTVAMPIQKQTTAAQTGKVLLPSMSKTATTAKVTPNTASGGVAKTVTQATPKPKGRPKGAAKTSPAVTSPASNQSKSETGSQSSASKPSTPTTSLPVTPSPDLKSQSDSEVEMPPKKSTNEEAAAEEQEHDSSSDRTEPPKVESNCKKETSTVVHREFPMAARPSIMTSDPPVEKQRAIVKPHILTHVIEGFVIQEGPEPFPVQRSSLLMEFIPPKPGQPVEQSSLISIEDEDMEQDDDTTSHEEHGPVSAQKSSQCELCNTAYSSANPAQRFCSKSCAKRYNVGCTKRLHHFPGRPKDKGRVMKRKRKGKKGRQGNRLQSTSSLPAGGDVEMEDASSSLSQEETPSPSTSPDHRPQTPSPQLSLEPEYCVPQTSPTKWNVQEVYDFIKNLQGCTMYADEFKSQEIDGQALLLLKEDHLMSTMNMKLGPALKICAKINAIKEETG